MVLLEAFFNYIGRCKEVPEGLVSVINPAGMLTVLCVLPINSDIL